MKKNFESVKTGHYYNYRSIYVFIGILVLILFGVYLAAASYFDKQYAASIISVQPQVLQKSNTKIATPQVKINPEFQLTRTLITGLSGSDVIALQKFLNTHGFPVAKTGPGSLNNETSYFGTLTMAALSGYQASVGLSVTGFLDSPTMAVINNGNSQRVVVDMPGDGGICSGDYVALDFSGLNEGSVGSTGLDVPEPTENPNTYERDGYNCRNFAERYCSDMKEQHPGVKCSLLFMNEHALNTIEFTDENGVEWVCIVDRTRGSNNSECFEKSVWQGLMQDPGFLIRICNSLGLPKCDSTIPNISPFDSIQSCKAQIGTACSSKNIYTICTTDNLAEPSNPHIDSLWCVCGGSLRYEAITPDCQWRKVFQPTTPPLPR